MRDRRRRPGLTAAAGCLALSLALAFTPGCDDPPPGSGSTGENGMPGISGSPAGAAASGASGGSGRTNAESLPGGIPPQMRPPTGGTHQYTLSLRGKPGMTFKLLLVAKVGNAPFREEQTVTLPDKDRSFEAQSCFVWIDDLPDGGSGIGETYTVELRRDGSVLGSCSGEIHQEPRIACQLGDL